MPRRWCRRAYRHRRREYGSGVGRIRTQPLGGFLVLAPFVGVAVMKGIAYPVQNIVIKHQSAKKRPELLFENLFTAQT
jgi:hypothetical protein